MGLFIYNLFLFFYTLGIRIAATWNPKARLWINGRKHSFEKLHILRSVPQGRPVIWIHCASLGEFEQGRPVIEALKQQYPGCIILLSFFSPSGYEVRKDYPLADVVVYLPMDSAANARKFIREANPTLVIWVKYEYWFHYLFELKSNNIPVLLVSAIFREGQPFFKWYGDVWKKMLGYFRHLFVQTSDSAERLANIGIREAVTISGDTRFDRVIEIAENFKPLPRQLAEYCGDHKVLVAGSTWEPDEVELVHYVKAHPEIRFIIAPHEIDESHIRNLHKLFGPTVLLYSQLILGNSSHSTKNVLVIDNIGMLSRLYRYATVTYVGGGFGEDGIHNVLEAAVYGKPVLFGPSYEKFAEAVGLVEAGGAFPVNNAIELESLLDKLFTNSTALDPASAAARKFVYDNRGATGKILEYIQENRLLTS